MQIFLLLITVLYIVLILLCIYITYKLIDTSRKIKQHTEEINKLEQKLYKDLRNIQFKSYEISKQANKYLNGKNSLLGEIISTLLLAFLPFKKIKSLIYLHKLGKKII